MRDLKFNEIDTVAGGRFGNEILPLPPVQIGPNVKPGKPFDPVFGTNPIDPVGGCITPIDPPVI
jgi:hypothetical protein